jgi:hypothetical protein
MSRNILRSVVVAAALVVVVGVLGAGAAEAQVLVNPYRQVEGWATLPGGRTMGAVGGVTMDPDGEHVWAVIRCSATAPDRFGNECLDSDLDPVIKFNQDGNVVESFGGGLFIWPHGIDVDSDGNVWVTDAVSEARTPEGTRGHQVIKFGPTGEVLMTLGTPGKPGVGNNSFNAPADVVIADNGDIFVADGHGNNTNNRVVKFSNDGTFIKSWGPAMGRVNSEPCMPSRWMRTGASSSAIGRTTACRSSTRRENSWRSGPSSVGPAASSSTTTGVSSSRTLNRTTSRTQAGKWGSGSARWRPGGSLSSFSTHGVIREARRAMARSSWRWTDTATSMAASRLRGVYRNIFG